MEKVTSFLIVLKEVSISIAKWIEIHNTFVTAAATIVIAVFTGALVWANIRMWRVMRASTTLAEKNMIIGQRAYVFVRKFNVIKNNGPHKLSVIPEWYNNGSTQANYLLTCVNGKYFPFVEYPEGIPDDYTFPDLAEREDWPMDHGPKSMFYGDPLNFSEETVNNTIAGHGRIYVWGWVEYNDIFDTYRHRTEFCDEVVIKSIDDEDIGISGMGIRSIGIRSHKKHNGADDYCLKKPMTKYVPPT